MQNTVLVTGGNGFIGTWVLRELLARQMALADFCHMLLSSNEFLYVE